MSDAELPRLPRIAPAPTEEPGGVVVPLRPGDRKSLDQRARRRAVREKRRQRPPRVMRWRRLWLLMIPIGILAAISTVFGMVIAIAATLPSINHIIVTAHPQNSLLYDDDGHRIAVMTDDVNRAYYVPPADIPDLMKRAIVSIEDKRFYTESGVDVRGIARAFLNDVTGSGNTQGGSTITEQLVKVIRNAEAPAKRTIFEKLTEAALAFQLAHKYSKDQVLTAYLNNVYYGNGAYGIEAAAQTYFGNDPTTSLFGCGYTPGNPKTLCVQRLTPADAALLAGLVQNPPVNWSSTSYYHARRDEVLFDMWQQGYISKSEYLTGKASPMPPARYVIAPGNEDTNPGYGYFTSWVEQQVLSDKKYLPNPYTAGYQIHTTLDEPLQNIAQNVAESILPPHAGLPESSVVVINNQTGGVMAMYGGNDYSARQFNTATQGERQPGSAWKPFELAKALERGVSPNQVFPSAPWTWKGGPGPPFPIRNDEGSYAGTRTLAEALTVSDNSVFARIGLEYAGPWGAPSLNNVAHYAHDFGITTDISRNPAMTIGGLYTGVTTLDMAHAYSTIARGGALASGTLASTSCAGGLPVLKGQHVVISQAHWKDGTCPGPPGISVVTRGRHAKVFVRNEPRYYQVPGFSYYLDQEERTMMRSVVTQGTGGAAALPNLWVAGKTGTTSQFLDAWFVGFTQALPGLPDGITVAVWVGYDTPRSMKYTYGGKPVYGGTYPADIFKKFVEDALPVITKEAYDRAHHISQSSLLASTETPVQLIPISALPNYGTPSTPSTSSTAPTGTTTATGTTSAAGTTTNTPTTPTTPLPTSAGGGAAAP